LVLPGEKFAKQNTIDDGCRDMSSPREVNKKHDISQVMYGILQNVKEV
jgi:hypothetical protein